MLKRCVSQILIALLCSASWSMAQPQRPNNQKPQQSAPVPALRGSTFRLATVFNE